MRAIIADDDSINRFLLKEYLQEFNFDFYFAENGLEALKILQEDYFGDTLLFLDINMPLLDGYEVLQALSYKNPIYPSTIKIICNSCISKQEFKSSADRATYDYFIEKPINKAELFDAVNNCISYVGTFASNNL